MSGIRILFFSIFLGSIISLQAMDRDSLMKVTFSRRMKDSFIDRSFAPNYKEKYKGQPYQYEDKEKNALERWLENNSQNKAIKFSPLWANVFKALIILGLAYGVYIIISLLMGKKGNWIFKNDTKTHGLQYALDIDDVTESNFTNLISQAVAQGNYRLAVRYQYLNTLQRLDQKGVIKYHKEKTNADYRNEIKSDTLAQSFQYVSYIYDYTWYGGFDVSDVTYRLAAAAYGETNKMI
ncbi:MAG: DUF4129 domain-containing protein [Saprospiraceae bacterium]|nr:DUF4129 domain-containing protein [Saprospiraceae bacterium]